MMPAVTAAMCINVSMTKLYIRRIASTGERRQVACGGWSHVACRYRELRCVASAALQGLAGCLPVGLAVCHAGCLALCKAALG